MDFGASVTRRLIDYPVWRTSSKSYEKEEYSEVIVDTSLLKRISDFASFSMGFQWNDRNINNGSNVAINEPEYSRSYMIPFEIVLMDGAGWLFGASQSFYNHKFTYRRITDPDLKQSSWVTSIHVSKVLPGKLGRVRLGVENVLDSDKEVSNFDQSLLMYYPNRFIYCSANIYL